MSTLIALKLDDSVILATDSRTMDNTIEHVVSDAQPKIHEISSGVFYGWNGAGMLALPQAQIATTLAKVSDMTDLRAFANKLDELSRESMEELVSVMRGLPSCGPQIRGEIPFHVYALMGVSEGCPGYLWREFVLVNGEITVRETYGFKLAIDQNFSLTAFDVETIRDLIWKPETWAGGPIAGVERFVERMRERNPRVGGPTQLACIDRFGSRWIRRPTAKQGTISRGALMPASISGNAGNITGILSVGQIGTGTLPVGVVYSGTVQCSQLQAGTISAAISMTAPTLVISGGSVTVNVDPANYVKVSNSSSSVTCRMTGDYFTAYNPNYSAQLNPSQLSLAHTATGTSISVGSDSIMIGLAGGSYVFGQTASIGYAKPGGGSGTLTFTNGILTAWN
jgi:hypothetical protein